MRRYSKHCTRQPEQLHQLRHISEEQENFKGVHRCPNYVDGREPEGQIEMEDIYMRIIEMFEEEVS